MRVMYFAFEGFDTKNGTNHLAIKMLDEFLENNIEVYLMTSHTTGDFEDIPPILKNRKGFTYDIVDRLVVSKSNFIQRYVDGVKYALNSWKKWRDEIDKVDVVILQSTPTSLFSTLLLYFLGKKPIIYNNFDVFPEGSYQMGAIKNKLVFKLLQFMQHSVYKMSDKIVVISSDMKKQFIHMGVSEDKLIEIKNWFDDSTIQIIPESNNQFIKKYNIDTDKFYVQYAGNFGYTFDYRMVLDVAERLQEYKNIEFQMIGDGAFRNDFVNEAEARNLNNIKFFPWQPLDIISDVYNTCSVQLIPLSKGVINNSFPSKSSILMACEKTFLCTTESDSDFYNEINKKGVGICVPNNSPDLAAEKIVELSKNQKILKNIGNKAKEYANLLYSSSVNVPKYVELVNSYDKKIASSYTSSK